MANTLKFGNGTWATKKGSTLAYNDENDRFKPLPFTTTRASGATRVNKEGLIEVVESDRPRIDYTDSADGALLLEPSRTNLVTYSEDFTNASWTGAFVGNNAISPDGALNADKFVFTQGASFPQFFKSVSGLVIGQEYTSTIYIKKTENSIDFEMNSSGILFSPTNEWQRVVKTFTATSTTQNVLVNYVVSVGIGVVKEIYVWGAQIEEGSYPTSYIPTNESATTRLAETCTNSGGDSTFNDSEGVLMAEISALADDSTYRLITLSDGTGSNRIAFFYGNTSNQIRFFVTSNGSSQADQNRTSFDIKLNNKIALKYKENDFALWINGYEILTDLEGITPSGLNDLSFAEFNKTGNPFYGKIKQIQYFNTALTDNELQKLTTI